MNYKKLFLLVLSLGTLSNFCVGAEELFTTDAAYAVSSEVASDSIAEANALVANKINIQDYYIYNINAQALSSSSLKLTMNLTPNLILEVDRVSATQSATGSTVWKGRVSSQTGINSENTLLDDSVIMIIRNGKITGTIRTQGRLFKIQPLSSGQHIVLEINEEYMKPDHPAGAMQELEAQMQFQAFEPILQSSSPQAAANPVIRTLVVYTATAAIEVTDMPSLVDLAIAETNQGFVNSAVNASVELAHLQGLTYKGVSISTDLTRLKSKTDGYMDEIHALRDKHNADVVMLIVADDGSGCGRAAAIGAVESTAFAVTAQDCATGYYSFGHELGHLLSARHDPNTDSSRSPYRFGHGYWDPAGKWRTVMSYSCGSGCTRINWWSNPNNDRNGTKMGTTALSDNTRVLNITSSIVAGFRDSGTAPPPTGNELENGVALTGLSEVTGNELLYTMRVPAGATDIKFVINGGVGDADLYVRFASAPTNTEYDCRPYLPGNEESCNSNFNDGIYYIRVKAYEGFSGVSLVGSYNGGTGPAPETLEYFVTEDLYVGNLGRFKNVTNVFVDGLHKNEETRGLLKFDVNTFNSPNDKKVKSVKVRLGINNTSRGRFAFYAATTFWSEKSADWSSAALNGQQIGTIYPTTSGTQSFDLNTEAVALVQGWIDGSVDNDGIVLSSLGTTDGVKFYSRSHATGVSASLVIEYQ